jgi:hypothetical protein
VDTKQRIANSSSIWSFLDSLNILRFDSCSQLLSTKVECVVRSSVFLPICVGIQGTSDKNPKWSSTAPLNPKWSFEDEYRWVNYLG